MALLKTLPARVKMAPLATHHQPVQRQRGRARMQVRDRVMERDCGLCQPCRSEGRVRHAVEVDHIVPLHLGGTEDMANQQAICAECHRVKAAGEAQRRAAGDVWR